nr:AraC family transcriptional regulator [Nocardia bovistercoris]
MVVPPTILTAVVEIGRRHAIPVAPWFEGLDIDPLVLHDPSSARLTVRQTVTVLERALTALPAEPWGMRIGTRDIVNSLGVLGVALTACGSVTEAIALGSELNPATGSLLDPTLEVSEHHLTLHFEELEPEPALAAFLYEQTLCTALVFLRTVLGADLNPISVDLPYPAPCHVEEYHRLFRCPIDFEADRGRIRFPISILERRFPFADLSIRAAAVDAYHRLLRAPDPRTDLIRTVETLLDGRHPAPTAADIARRLHMSERTLRRRLQSAGESFGTVRDRVRERRTTRMLRESTLTVDAIAREIGFCDARELRRAYQRWTGCALSTVRRGPCDTTA